MNRPCAFGTGLTAIGVLTCLTLCLARVSTLPARPTGCASTLPAESAHEPETAPVASPQSPLARVYSRICRLRARENCLLQQEDHPGLMQVSAELATLLKSFRTAVPPAPHTAPHVHAVGIYSAQNSGEPVPVRVSDSSGPIVLVLCGYESVIWQVDVASGAAIDFVVCGGYFEQQVCGLPDDVPVFSAYYGSGSEDWAWAYGDERSAWEGVERWLSKLAGLPMIHTVQGSYHEPPTPFVIGATNVDWRVQMLAHQLPGAQHERRGPANARTGTPGDSEGETPERCY